MLQLEIKNISVNEALSNQIILFVLQYYILNEFDYKIAFCNSLMEVVHSLKKKEKDSFLVSKKVPGNRSFKTPFLK